MLIVKRILSLLFPIVTMFFIGLLGLVYFLESNATSFFNCWTDLQTQELLCRPIEPTGDQMWLIVGQLAIVMALVAAAGWVVMPEKRSIIEAAPFRMALHNRLMTIRQRADQNDPTVTARINELEEMIQQYERSCSLYAEAQPIVGSQREWV